ncbi:MAG: GpE family phage tail protein [Alphaproteobacteria bacterium HGW-Alphaproteobacteria-16]|nr:MAG: GpE family phage tail protein [Alphaproteobacteria bacterium HGW-Alphaproteobacteria-16]
MADIAAIFHWPLSELRALDVDELITWRDLAIERWNRMQGEDE